MTPKEKQRIIKRIQRLEADLEALGCWTSLSIHEYAQITDIELRVNFPVETENNTKEES